MSGFDAEWLRRREPLDRAARADALERDFAAAIRAGPDGVRRVVDLASGSGANFRVLAPRIAGDQDWLLVDHDPRLLDEQPHEIERWARGAGWRVDTGARECRIDTGRARWRVRGLAFDLADRLEDLPLESFDAVTTAAFLDLVSGAWVERLCACLARAARPLLAVLTVDGRRAWSPAGAADPAVLAAFVRHQRGDKGFGPALGAAAIAQIAQRLAALGFDVRRAHSDWRIGPHDHGLLASMLDEAATIAGGDDDVGADAARWRETRRAQLAQGRLSLEVGHEDLLALPARARAGDAVVDQNAAALD